LRNPRWRVNDNLPGTRDFCPLVRLSDPLNAAGQVDPRAALAGLDAEFGPDMLLRSASWLTFKESQASFAIEREADQDARIRRFAHVIAEHCGRVDEPLSDATLALLQSGILGMPSRKAPGFSRPLMRRYAGDYHFGEREIAADGTPFDFVFEAYDDAQFAWRFPDLTEHALYTCRLIESTIVDQMAGEARVLRRFDTASRRLKAVIEMPDPDVTRVIRSLKENGWAASGKLLKEYPVFDDPSRQQQAIEAVRSAFEDRPPANIAGA
jgi:hypothetical protein